jgi:hypothetical protein
MVYLLVEAAERDALPAFSAAMAWFRHTADGGWVGYTVAAEERSHASTPK